MSQRTSGFARMERDLYETPTWVTQALIRARLKAWERNRCQPVTLWEPAAGGGQIVQPLRDAGYGVMASDLAGRTSGADASAPLMRDFLALVEAPPEVRGIITNPPYKLAEEFVRQALGMMCLRRGLVAMLLRIDFDSAKTRRDMFADCRAWGHKLVLTQRIVWFEGGGSSPSENHAWYVWDWRRKGGPPTIGYAP